MSKGQPLENMKEETTMEQLNIAMKKETDTSVSYFVYPANMQMFPDGPCTDTCDSYAELVQRHGKPVGYFNACGAVWAVLPPITVE